MISNFNNRMEEKSHMKKFVHILRRSQKNLIVAFLHYQFSYAKNLVAVRKQQIKNVFKI